MHIYIYICIYIYILIQLPNNPHNPEGKKAWGHANITWVNFFKQPCKTQGFGLGKVQVAARMDPKGAASWPHRILKNHCKIRGFTMPRLIEKRAKQIRVVSVRETVFP